MEQPFYILHTDNSSNLKHVFFDLMLRLFLLAISNMLLVNIYYFLHTINLCQYLMDNDIQNNNAHTMLQSDESRRNQQNHYSQYMLVD